jgi:epoxyqueuosine reductase
LTDLTKRTKEFVLTRGATLVGIATANSLLDAPKGHRPRDFFPKAKTVISIGLNINKTAILQLPRTKKEYKTVYDMTNLKLNSLAWETAHFLTDLGYEALAIPASAPYDETKNFGDISHKHAAAATGLGKFGLNNLILTPSHGAYVRFVTLLTTAKLKPDKPSSKDVCLGMNCMKCVKACPVNALKNPKNDGLKGWRIDRKKCKEYINAFSGGSVCGFCIKACPIAQGNRSA